MSVLDRLIRVRTIRARQALLALGRAQARIAAEAELQERLARLLQPPPTGASAPQAVQARASANAMLAGLGGHITARRDAALAERDAAAAALARAQAAVDAAIERRASAGEDA